MIFWESVAKIWWIYMLLYLIYIIYILQFMVFLYSFSLLMKVDELSLLVRKNGLCERGVLICLCFKKGKEKWLGLWVFSNAILEW